MQLVVSIASVGTVRVELENKEMTRLDRLNRGSARPLTSLPSLTSASLGKKVRAAVRDIISTTREVIVSILKANARERRSNTGFDIKTSLPLSILPTMTRGAKLLIFFLAAVASETIK